MLAIDDGGGNYNPMKIAPMLLRVGGRIATDDMSSTITSNAIAIFLGKSYTFYIYYIKACEKNNI